MGTIGTVSAASAAAISTQIAKKSIRKQDEQFQKTIEPYLVPQFPIFRIDHSLRSSNFLFSRWDNKISLEERVKAVKVPLLNIGNGVAKEIEIEFEIQDLNQIVEIYKTSNLNDFMDDRLGNVEIDIYDGDALPFPRVLFMGRNEPYRAFLTEELERFHKYNIPFLKKEDGEGTTIEIPYAFIMLSNIWCHTNLRGINIPKPKLLLKVTCEDLSNKIHHFNYLICILNTHSIQFPNKSEFLELILEVKKV